MEGYPENYDPKNLEPAVAAVKHFPGLEVIWNEDQFSRAKLEADAKASTQRFNLSFSIMTDDNEINWISFTVSGGDLWQGTMGCGPAYEEGVPRTFEEFLKSTLGPTQRDIKLMVFERHNWECAEAFSEFYGTFLKALYPRLEHWQLTGAPEEDYMEAVQAIHADKLIISRLHPKK